MGAGARASSSQRSNGAIVNFESVERIAEAVLYEGYMLYPYRPSSVKNQHRFNFGVLCPKAYCDVQGGSESSFLQTECLLRTAPSTRITVKVRFLQIAQRLIRRYDSGGPEFVDRLWVDGRTYQPWQEAEERSFSCETVDPAVLQSSHTRRFEFPAGQTTEPIRDAQGTLAGEMVLEWQSLSASLHLSAERCRDDITRLRVRLENCSDGKQGKLNKMSRDAALLYSLVSAHTILGVENGEFLSLLESPAEFEDLAHSCENIGAWPVLAGDRDATTVLASPIILYDYPQIAPESAGNLFDATEIDEILSLRILTLTDQEKAEVRQSDDRARQLLERTENIPDEQFMKLHGVLRGLTALKEDPQ